MFTDEMIEKMVYTAPAVITPATEHEMRSAFIKLKNASSFVKPDIFNNLRKYFEGSDLNPTMFQKFLIRNFDVELNSGELDAAIRVFDLNNDGVISYGEFMATFYQLGLEEKSRRLFQQKNNNIQRINNEKEIIRKKAVLFDKGIRSHITYPKLPEEDEVEEEANELDAPSLPYLLPKNYKIVRNGSISSRSRLQLAFPRISTDTKVKDTTVVIAFTFSVFIFHLFFMRHIADRCDKLTIISFHAF